MRIILILTLFLLTACSNESQQAEGNLVNNHAHDGSSETEVLRNTGQSSYNGYDIELDYTYKADDIMDVSIRIYDGETELVQMSEEGTLENDTDPSLYNQIERLRQYMVGFNKFPTLDNEGHSDELITISIDMRGIEDSYLNANE